MNEEELRRHLLEVHRATTDEASNPEVLHRKLHQWASHPKDRHDHETVYSELPKHGNRR